MIQLFQMNKPYFLWDYDLTNNQIKNILNGSNSVEKRWLISRIITHARYEDIWQYLTIKDIVEVFDKLRLPAKTKKAWQHALNVWGYHA